MSCGLDEMVDGLGGEVNWLHAQWTLYRQLFAEPDTVDILNETASHCFAVMQKMIQEDVFLTLGRLTDEPRSRSYEHLSLPRLAEAVNATRDWELAGEVSEHIDAVRRQCAPVREWRDRRLAHADLPTALDRATNPLPGVTVAEIEAMLVQLRLLMNVLNKHLHKTYVAYEVQSMKGDGRVLLGALQLAKAHREKCLRSQP